MFRRYVYECFKFLPSEAHPLIMIFPWCGPSHRALSVPPPSRLVIHPLSATQVSRYIVSQQKRIRDAGAGSAASDPVEAAGRGRTGSAAEEDALGKAADRSAEAAASLASCRSYHGTPQDGIFGCQHYQRKCHLIAPCCNKVRSVPGWSRHLSQSTRYADSLILSSTDKTALHMPPVPRRGEQPSHGPSLGEMLESGLAAQYSAPSCISAVSTHSAHTGSSGFDHACIRLDPFPIGPRGALHDMRLARPRRPELRRVRDLACRLLLRHLPPL